MVLDGTSSQEYPVNARIPQGFILGPTLLLLCLNDLPIDFICNTAFLANHTALNCTRDQTSDLWQQLVLASELESYLEVTLY